MSRAPKNLMIKAKVSVCMLAMTGKRLNIRLNPLTEAILKQ